MSEDLRILLELLRSTKLDWLDQEVQAAITAAKESFETHDEPKRDDLPLFREPTPRGWTDADELRVAIATIYLHLVQPVQMWSAAEKSLHREANCRLALLDGEATKTQPFPPEVYEYAIRFEQALAEIWPGGPRAFNAHFS